MTTLREAASAALAALEGLRESGKWGDWDNVTGVLRAALAEPTGKEDLQVEPVAWIYQNSYTNDEYLVWHQSAGGRNWRPLYTAPPQRKPLSVTDLQDALVYANLIDRDAIDDPDNYDEGSTLAQIDALHQMLTQPQREPLTKEEISSIWDGHTVTVFGRNGINPIAFARAIERAHGIGDNT